MHTLSYALSLLSFCLEEGDEAWYIVATESKAACPEEEYGVYLACLYVLTTPPCPHAYSSRVFQFHSMSSGTENIIYR